MVSQKVRNLLLVFLLALLGVGSVYGQSCSPNGRIQLTQTSSIDLTNSGRVEICMNGVWGTIAAESVNTPWGEKNAQVACIELGFSGVLNSILQRTIPFFEQSSLPTHLVNVRCDGSETNISDCSSTPTNSPANLGYDAYIVCRPQTRSYSDVHPAGVQSGDIRLFGDTRNGYGAVEIYSTTRGWQGICPDSFWTDSDAATICQDLGYQSGTTMSSIFALAGSNNRVPPRGLYAASCPAVISSDVTLGVCSFRTETTFSTCGVSQGWFAAVRCTNASERSVRLIGGTHSREGIVETAYNGRWGMVCDGGFTSTDARSICQGLGFGTSDATMMSLSSVSSILDNESNLKPIWLNQLTCTSSDTSLSACITEQNIIGFVDCRSLDIAAIDCGDPPESLSSGRIVGIVIGTLAGVVVVFVFVYIFGKDYWAKRHTYSWYNTLTTPSEWCDCFSCDCDISSPRRTQPTATVTIETSSASTTRYTNANPETNTTTTFNLTPRQVPPPEPEPEPEPELSDPSLSKAPPPSYHAASNFPVHDLKPDLPPPYPGGPELAYPPPSAPPSAPPPNTGGAYPPAWNQPAYPPPPPTGNPTQLPYPTNDTPYPS